MENVGDSSQLGNVGQPVQQPTPVSTSHRILQPQISIQSATPDASSADPTPASAAVVLNSPKSSSRGKKSLPTSKSASNLNRNSSAISKVSSRFQSLTTRLRIINQLSTARRHQLDSESIGPGGGALPQEPTPMMFDIGHKNKTMENDHLHGNYSCCFGENGRDPGGGDCFDDDTGLKDGIISGGELVFDNDFKSKSQIRPYIYVMPDVKVENVANVLVDEWQLPIPRIAAFILTNCGDLRTWANQRQIASFKKGLMKAANTTSMWLVTNGLDVGVSKLIGDSVEQELKEIKTFRYNEKNKSSFNVIGISNDNNLSYTQQFFGPSIPLGKPGPITSENRYELNQQHTNFVVLKSSRNSSDNANSALLLNLIDYLTKRNLRLRRRKERQQQLRRQQDGTHANGDNNGDDEEEGEEEDQNPVFTVTQNSNFTTMSNYYDAISPPIGESSTPLIRPLLAGQQQSYSGDGINYDTTDYGDSVSVALQRQQRSVSQSQSRITPTATPTAEVTPVNPLDDDLLSFVSKEGKMDSIPTTSLDSDTDNNDLTIQAQSCTIDSPLNKFTDLRAGPSSAGNQAGGSGDGSKQSLQPPSIILSNTIVPVICLVIQGGFNCSKLVLENLRRHNPVIVFRGSGGFADLLSYAYLEMHQRCRDLYSSWDAEFVEHTLKPLLTTKIVKRFPLLRNNALGRNSFRDRIIECVRESGSPKGRVYLTILNMHNSSCDLENLPEHILLSLFKSQNRRDTLDANLLRKDLYLTLDWNCSHVALDEVLRRNPTYNLQLEKSIFEVSLIRDNREDFVDLFLSHGFRIHKYLTPFRLRRLIRYSLMEKEFFRTICMDNIIGIPVWSVNFEEMLTKLDSVSGDSSSIDADNFIMNEFNQLIFTTTYQRNFINVEDLYLNIMGLYPVDEDSAERKSLAILAMWAVFNRRIRLAEVLWKHSDQPVHLALIISMMLERLAWFVSEQNLKDDLLNNSKQFQQFAIGVMDVCYRQDEKRAYDLLSQQNSDWDRKTAVDIAANGSHRSFIAHSCCQKWLTNLFNGRIRIRELSWGITISPVIKIILSAFLIFPMYVWIRFLDTSLIGPGGGTGTGGGRRKQTINPDFEDSDSEEDLFLSEASEFKLLQMNKKKKEEEAAANVGQGQSGEKNNRRTTSTSNINANNNKSSVQQLQSEVLRNTLNRWRNDQNKSTDPYYFLRQRPLFIQRQPPIWTMIYLMWNSPITKFWTYQVLYILYLAILSLAVIYPGCGNWYLDTIACLWTFLSLVEQISRTILLYSRYTSVPMFFKCVEIMALVVFLAIYTFGRVLVWENHTIGYLITPYMMKVTLCLGLLYFYYRLFAIHLPISPTLGPLLYRFKLMITVDFIHFMRMALILLISSGIIIQAVLYPNTELSIDMFHKAFHRAAISLFLTPVDELTVKCRRNFDNSSLMRWYDVEPEFNMTSSSPSPKLPDFIQSSLFQSFYSITTCPRAPISMADSCPQTGFWAYFFSFQYLIFLKLILMTLLYALFANTASRLQTETDHIWKYQRYLLVIDFANRPALHAPLSFFAYLYAIVRCLLHLLTCRFICCQPCRKRSRNDQLDGKVFQTGTGNDPDSDDLLMNQNKRLSQEDYNFWRHLAKNFYEEEEQRRKNTNLGATSIISKQLETVQVINEEIEHGKHVLRTIKTKMAEMERLMYQTHIYLESIKHSTVSGPKQSTADSSHPSHHTHSGRPPKHQHSHHHNSPFGTAPSADSSFASQIHHLSRMSPYSGTRIQRFPIADKFVSWDIIWINYDPVIYSKKREDFTLQLKQFVDEDVLALKARARFLARTGNGYDDDEDESRVVHLPVFNWNTVSCNPAGLTIDRRSWLVSKNKILMTGEEDQKERQTFLIYKLDEGIPVNPFGRTGLRGKGNLPRWGPNHYAMLVITRSRTMLFGGGSGRGDTGTTILQFALEHRSNSLQIPMRFVGDEKLFGELGQLFNHSSYGSTTSVMNHWNTEEEMFDYFRNRSPSTPAGTPTLPNIAEISFAGDSSSTHSKSPSSSKFAHCEPAYSQYLDSPDNTDNSWKEVKVFHIHFNTKTPNSITDNLFSFPASGGVLGGGSTSSSSGSNSSMLVWLNSTEDLLIRLPLEQVSIMNSIIRRFHPDSH